MQWGHLLVRYCYNNLCFRWLIICFVTGLVIRPHAAEISFNRSDLTNYNKYIQQLHELLQREYTHVKGLNRLCSVDITAECSEALTSNRKSPPKLKSRFVWGGLTNCSVCKCPEYNDSVQEQNDLCLVGEYTEQDDEPIKKVCQFKRSMLRQCSGLPDTSFGYAEGKPCIIIKMNRVSDPFSVCLLMNWLKTDSIY